MSKASAISPRGLTEKQQKWFASVKEGLEKETGKSFDEWVKIARTCPETRPRARQKWLKETHGLGVNRASVVLEEAFGGLKWDQPDALEDALWRDDSARAIFTKLKEVAEELDGVTCGQRKGYTPWSRKYQFAAARPVKDTVRLGLAVPPTADSKLQAPKSSDGWSERLKSVAVLEKPADINANIIKLLKTAWENS